ncbi:MAG TPA: S26 family signal peptidase [Anaerolineales bacterium]
MLRLFKISEDSLSPEFQDGDFVLALKIPIFLQHIRPGAIIVFKQKTYGTLIKRVEHISADRKDYFVVGNHPVSIDSRQFGPVPRQNVIGKVIWHIPRPRG